MYRAVEISKMLGVSKVTIYNDFKKFKSELNPYIITEKGSKYLNEEGFELLKKLRENKDASKVVIEVNSTDSTGDLNKVVENELREQLESFKEQVKYLKYQLEISQKNIEREQQLHEHTQVLLKQVQDQLLLMEPEVRDTETEKKSIWSRIFKP